MNTSLHTIAKSLYDHVRAGGASHEVAVQRTAATLLVISPGTPPDVIESTMAYIVGLVHARQTTTVMSGPEPFVPWFRPEMKAGWIRWRRYRRYLLEKKNWASESVIGLDESSDAIVAQIGDPRTKTAFDRRGLVVGSVQSGKTASYMALMSKAIDAGYSVVIVLAGIHNSLRHQTQARIDEEILGVRTKVEKTESNHTGVGLLEPSSEHPYMQYLTGQGENGDFSGEVASKVGLLLGATPTLLVIKKNVFVLEHLITYLRGLSQAVKGEGGGKQLREIPLLLVDDEADQASINFRPVRDETDELDPGLEPSRINEQIRKLLVCFTQRTYVGYTATPFANVLISPEGVHPLLGPDLFPRDFIITLQPPDDYIGPRQVFGGGPVGDGSGAPGMPVVRVVSDHGPFMPDKHRQDHAPTAPPASLRRAVLSYLLAGAIRCCRGQATRHHTMLVHVTRFTAVQLRVASLVDGLLKRLRQILEFGSGAPGTPDSREALLDEFWGLLEQDFVPTSAAMEAQLPARDEIEKQLLPGLKRVKTLIINGDAGDVLDYTTHAADGAWIVAVGGDKLSRGLTLEGLCVSYYLRASRTYDTLMQMGRWFGYRPGYADLCRIHTTAELVSWFQHIVLATEELWDEFETMQREGSTPGEFGLRLRAHPAMEVTSPLKMQEAERISLNYSGTVKETIMFDLTVGGTTASPDSAVGVVAANQKAVEELVGGLGEAGARSGDRGPYLWRGVPVTTVLAFLAKYRTHPQALTVIASRMADYILHHVPGGLLTTWTVAVMSAVKAVPANGTGTAGGRIVHRYQRSILDAASTPECTRIGRMLSPADELLDLDEAELTLLLSNRPGKTVMDPVTAQDARGYDIKGPPPSHIGRPPTRALLILYPLVLGAKAADLKGSATVWGLAISFPRSGRLLDHEFIANPVWLEQMAAREPGGSLPGTKSGTS